MRFPRREYWSGLPFPSPGYLPDPGIEPGSPTLQADSLPSELPGTPSYVYVCMYVYAYLCLLHTYMLIRNNHYNKEQYCSSSNPIILLKVNCCREQLQIREQILSASGFQWALHWKWKWKSVSRVRLFATPWTVQSMKFSRPQYWIM